MAKSRSSSMSSGYNLTVPESEYDSPVDHIVQVSDYVRLDLSFEADEVYQRLRRTRK